MGMIERVTESDVAEKFEDLMERVRKDGATFEIMRDGQVVARIVPAVAEPAQVTDSTTAKLGTIDALLAALEKVPRLCPEDSAAWEADQEAIRKAFPMQERKWD